MGIKLGKKEKTSWADNIAGSVSKVEINNETRIVIHPTYYRALGIVGHSEEIEE